MVILMATALWVRQQQPGQRPAPPGPWPDYLDQPEGAIAPVPECARTALCLAPSDTTLITPANCTDATCRWGFRRPSQGTTPHLRSGSTTTDLMLFWRARRRRHDHAGPGQLVQAGVVDRNYPVIGGATPLTAMYGEQLGHRADRRVELAVRGRRT